MKKILILFMILLITSSVLFGQNNEVRFGERPFIDIYKVPDEAIEQGRIRIKFREDRSEHLDNIEQVRDEAGIVLFGIEEIDQLNRQHQIRSVTKLFDSTALSEENEWRHRLWGFHLWYELHFDSRENIRDIVMAYRTRNGSLSWAEPEYKKQLTGTRVNNTRNEGSNRWTPNDQYIGLQWHYNNTGQQGGTPGADISLFDAWDIEKGHSDVIVAIIDGGIQFDHPDLDGNMWSGIGYNFVTDSLTISPHNHGTHVAGTVSAVTNNVIGVAGVAGGSGSGDGVRLMSCQVFTSTGSGGFHLAPIYAAGNAAAISQNSWGYTVAGVYDQAVLDAIDYFNTNGGGAVLNGGITIFAAGNEDDNGNWYPAYYSGAFAVAATNNQDIKSYYSNYGTWIDISAPGGETHEVGFRGVLSTIIDGYAYYQGTSMACPHASGVAGLIISYAYRNDLILTNSAVADILKNTTDDHYAVNSSFTGQLGTGRLNAHASLSAVQTLIDESFEDTETGEMVHDHVENTYTGEIDLDGDGTPDVIIVFTPVEGASEVGMGFTYSTNPEYPSVLLFPNPDALSAYFGFNLNDPADFNIFYNGTVTLQFPLNPAQIWYRQQGGSWQHIISSAFISGPDSPSFSYTIDLSDLLSRSSGYRNGDLEFAGDDGISTLPVELSAFNVTATSDMNVMLQWTAETETNMLGYNIFRGFSPDLANAQRTNSAIIPAQNSSVAVSYTYVDDNVEEGQFYYYWLQSNDLDLTSAYYGPLSIYVEDQSDPGTIPVVELETALIGAFPNPFNPDTAIRFSSAEPVKVTINIYNLLGQYMETLAHEQHYDKGIHSVLWDGRDSYGRDAASGIYFYHMKTDNGFSHIKKMVLIK